MATLNVQDFIYMLKVHMILLNLTFWMFLQWSTKCLREKLEDSIACISNKLHCHNSSRYLPAINVPAAQRSIKSFLIFLWNSRNWALVVTVYPDNFISRVILLRLLSCVSFRRCHGNETVSLHGMIAGPVLSSCGYELRLFSGFSFGFLLFLFVCFTC